MDLDRDPVEPRVGWPVAVAVYGNGVGDPGGIIGDDRVTFDREPLAAVDLADRRTRNPADVRDVCADIAVFKAFFNRTKDWADLEDMIAVGMIDIDQTIGALVRHLGADDERVQRLLDLTR